MPPTRRQRNIERRRNRDNDRSYRTVARNNRLNSSQTTHEPGQPQLLGYKCALPLPQNDFSFSIGPLSMTCVACTAKILRRRKPAGMLLIFPCVATKLVRLNAKGQLGIGERCVDADSQGIKLVFCKLGTVNGPWEYDEESHTLLHHIQKKCAGLHPQTHHLSLMPCDPVNTYQQWIFGEIHPNWS